MPPSISETDTISALSASSPLSANRATRNAPLLTIAARIALVCFAAYWLAGAVAMVWTGARIIHSPWENTYPESPQVYVAVRTARTGRLYFPLSDPPHVMQSYGPLLYVTYAAIAKLSHLDYDLITFRARSLAFVCYLLCGAMAYLIARRLRFSHTSALCAGLMLLAQKQFVDWNATVRSDMLFLLAMLLSLFFAVKSDATNRDYALAGVLGAVAFLLKQPGMTVVAAIGAILLIHKKYKAAAWLGLGAALPVLLTVSALLWRREPFLGQIGIVGKTVWSLAGGIEFTLNNVINLEMVLAILIGVIGFGVAIRGDERSQMVALFAATNWCMGLSGLPQLGSHLNYFLPGLAGCALLLPFVMRAMRERIRSPIVFAGAAVALLALLPGQLATASVALHAASPAPMISFAGLAPFHILSDRPGFTLRGRDPDYLDPYSTHGLEVTGAWSAAPIVAEIRRGDYDLIILACSASHYVCVFRGIAYFSPAAVEAINENYEVFCSASSSTVLVPRARPVAVTPEMLAPAFGAPCGTARRGAAPMILFPEGAR